MLALICVSATSAQAATESVWPAFQTALATCDGKTFAKQADIIRCRLDAVKPVWAARSPGTIGLLDEAGAQALAASVAFDEGRLTRPDLDQRLQRILVALRGQLAAKGQWPVTDPVWRGKPAAGEMKRYHPERASRAGIEGRAKLSCVVTLKGQLENCVLLSEEPFRQDFGAAALKVSQIVQMTPGTIDGTPVAGAPVQATFVFQLAPKKSYVEVAGTQAP